ncbi:hypothetical protein DFH08DRAFT_968949 [Mycena albidolilacea]|uniref:Uncharacterized protein n=1 Tax=Mycena albidolilacea TaxID=1033008 RepID=A0AAD6ZJ21_9AGAR|nr:hypothetical protein DFH08DRAFT_968949 [Mycena albidolilacea]
MASSPLLSVATELLLAVIEVIDDSSTALTAVLALPRALRSCHLGIMHYHTSPSNTCHQASPEQQLEAVRQQRHSLQQFTWFDEDFAYDIDVRRVSTVPGRGPYDFTALDGASALLFSTLLSECAPPNLDRLRIICHDKGTVLEHPFCRFMEVLSAHRRQVIRGWFKHCLFSSARCCSLEPMQCHRRFFSVQP